MKWFLSAFVVLFLSGCVQVFPEQPFGAKTIVIRVEGLADVDGPEVDWQLIVERPTTSAELDKNVIAVQDKTEVIRYISDTVLADDLTEVLERAIIDAFLESHKIKGVGGNGAGISADYILLSDVDAFGLYVHGVDSLPQAQFEMVAQLVEVQTRRVVAKKRFSARVAVPERTVLLVANALNEVVTKVLRDVLEWTLKTKR